MVDGAVVIEEDRKTLHRPKLAHSVLTVASMDTMLHSVQEEPVFWAVVVLHDL